MSCETCGEDLNKCRCGPVENKSYKDTCNHCGATGIQSTSAWKAHMQNCEGLTRAFCDKCRTFNPCPHRGEYPGDPVAHPAPRVRFVEDVVEDAKLIHTWCPTCQNNVTGNGEKEFQELMSKHGAGKCVKETDPVNKPAHYTSGKIEVIDFIEDQKLGFCLGNTVKYVARAGKKDPSKTKEDLLKAQWYLSRAISKLEQT